MGTQVDRHAGVDVDFGVGVDFGSHVQAESLQAVVGGQPLLIVGVAEPIVLTYSYMYSFARDRDDLGAPCRRPAPVASSHHCCVCICRVTCRCYLAAWLAKRGDSAKC